MCPPSEVIISSCLAGPRDVSVTRRQVMRRIVIVIVVIVNSVNGVARILWTGATQGVRETRSVKASTRWVSSIGVIYGVCTQYPRCGLEMHVPRLLG